MRASLLLLVCIAAGCAAGGPARTPPAEESGFIPEQSEVLLLYSRLSPAKLFEVAYELLLARGYEVSQSFPEYGYIATDGRRIGEQVALRIQMTIEEEGDLSRMAVAGAWLPGDEIPSEEEPLAAQGPPTSEAAWHPVRSGSTGSSAYAFGQMQDLVETLPHLRIERAAE